MSRRLISTSVAGSVLAVLFAATAEAQQPPDDVLDKATAAVNQTAGTATIAAGAGNPSRQKTQPASFGESVDDPGSAGGGGDGAPETDCVWVPVGPVAEVQAAQAAINAGQMPAVDDPAVDGALVLVPGVMGQFAETDWYRVTGTTAEVYHRLRCPDGSTQGLRWWPLVPDGNGNLVVEISADDLVPGARDEVVRRLPTPAPHIAPADEDSHGYAYVNMRTFFWIEQTPGQWHPVSATAGAGGITVTVTAEPVRVRVDPGDGSDPVVCDGAPTIVTRATYHPDIAGCTHTYLDSSAMAPNGETWPVTMSIVWHVTWTATTGQGGDLGYVATTAEPRDLPVAEIQAIITHVEN